MKDKEELPAHDWCMPNCGQHEHEEREDHVAPPVYKVTPRVRDDDGKKIGRNDPCPCLSGRKFKRCCWDKVH